GLALAAAVVTVWVTFVPCFLWIFVGAPYIDWISNQPRLAGALQAITAAVVGVILNLSLWFATHVLFAEVRILEWGPVEVVRPVLATIDLWAAGLAVFAAIALLILKWGLGRTLVTAAALGVILSWGFG
ncbi:MAG: chromate transporter, partial [Pseudomonadota bacterium]